MDWKEPNIAGPSPFLPPEEVRLIDLRKDGRFDTPVHPDTHLVDRRALMFLIRNTVVPEYDFTAPHINSHTSDHHLQWPRTRFDRTFRNRRSRRTNIRPIAHNWVHEATYPSPALSNDVEIEYTNGQEVADELRRIANHPAYLGRETLKIYREVYPNMTHHQIDVLKQEVYEDRKLDLTFAFDAFALTYERARSAPQEFQVIDYSTIPLRNIDDMMLIVQYLNMTQRMEAELDQMILDGKVTDQVEADNLFNIANLSNK